MCMADTAQAIVGRRAAAERGDRGRGAAVGGFTLLELMLSLGILMMAIAAVGFFVGPWLTGAGFEAQASQFAGAMRHARAEAVHTGRTLRLQFELAPDEALPDGQAYRLAVLQEFNPLDEPHRFTPVQGRAWVDQLLDADRVVVSEVRLTGPDAEALWALAGHEQEWDEPAESVAITFYPDGTCDSAMILLSPVKRGDLQRAAIRIEGLTGLVSLELTNVVELEEGRPEDLLTDDQADWMVDDELQ